MSDNTNIKTVEEKTTFPELLNHIKISGLTEEWRKYRDAVLDYEQGTKVEQNIFDSEQYENLISDTYDAFAPHAFTNRVPKYVLELYATIHSFGEIESKKTILQNENFPVRIAIAKSLCHLLDTRVELPDEERIVVFCLDKNQGELKAGYYIYDFNAPGFSYIGKKNPFE